MVQDDNNTIYLHQYDDMYASKYLPAIVFVAILMLVGVVGNSLVCYVYLFKFKPSTTRCFIVTLALLDILNCSLSMPLKIVHMRHHATSGLYGCRFATISLTFFSLASAAVLLPVAVDRYLKICKPFASQMTVFYAKVGCAVACTVAFLLTIPPAIIHGPTIHPLPHANATFCYLSDGERGTLPHVIYSGVQMLLFVMTAGALIVMYTCIWHRVYKQKKAFRQRARAGSSNRMSPNRNCTQESTSETLTTSPNVNRTSMNETSTISQQGNQSLDPQNDSSSLKTEHEQCAFTSPSRSGPIHDKGVTTTLHQEYVVRRMTLMLFLISLMFFISFLPYLIITVTVSSNKSFAERLTVISSASVIIFERSYFIQSACNPFIYSFCSVNFRREMMKVCR